MAGKIDHGLNQRQDLFCRYFVQSEEFFDNATLSYAAAYGYRLSELSRDDAIYEEDDPEDGDVEEDEQATRKRRLKKRYARRCIRLSSYDRAYNVCASEASKLLKKPKIQRRLIELRNEMLRDDFVDARLASLIKQNSNPSVALGAIREFNKLRKRTPDQLELSGPGGGPVVVDEKRRGLLDTILTANEGAKS